MKSRFKIVLALAGAIVFCAGASAHAQSGGGYEITSYSIDGGGGASTGGGYTLTGTIGQPDTGVSSGGEFVLSAGFWPGNFGCVVNLTDLTVLADWWLAGGAGMPADIDADEDVDMEDFAALAYRWYDTCPADWPVK